MKVIQFSKAFHCLSNRMKKRVSFTGKTIFLSIFCFSFLSQEVLPLCEAFCLKRSGQGVVFRPLTQLIEKYREAPRPIYSSSSRWHTYKPDKYAWANPRHLDCFADHSFLFHLLQPLHLNQFLNLFKFMLALLHRNQYHKKSRTIFIRPLCNDDNSHYIKNISPLHYTIHANCLL